MTTAVAPPRVQLRVCWTGELPQPGDCLLSPAGRVLYRINRVRRLHFAETSPRPRVELFVTKLPGSTDIPGHRYPWTMTTPPQPLPPRPGPGRVRYPRNPTLDEAAAQAKAKRLAEEAAPPRHADPSRWDDPEDAVRTKVPKQIRGHRRGDVIGLLHRRGRDVSKDQVEAARRFQLDWDVASIGLSSDAAFAVYQQQSAGPRMSPPQYQLARTAAQREVRRVLAFVGPSAAPLLMHVVAHNRDVRSWCRQHGDNEQKAFGKLLFVLDRLREFYGIDSRRDAVNQARKELAQP